MTSFFPFYWKQFSHISSQFWFNQGWGSFLPHFFMITIDTFIPATDLVISYNGQFHVVPFVDIVRIYKKGSQVTILTETGAYPTSQNLEELMRELPVNSFARLQKSHIISLAHFYLLQSIPITNYYKKELKKQMAAQLDQAYSYLLHKRA